MRGPYASLGRISKMRKGLGLTQKQLADLSGVSQSLVAKIESGKIDPAYSKVIQILSALEGAQKTERKSAEEIMTSSIFSVAPSDTLEKAIKLMHKNDISQVPVLESGKCVGSLSDSMLVELVSEKGTNLKSVLVAEVMVESFPVIPAKSVMDVCADLLKHYSAVLIEKNGKLAGIITKADFLKAV
ncbi:MAG: CBS domain-containing protein [Candidatus Micrarchaeota archaeon]